jgi:anion-transporting  ArsA/GET3 family ATPase
VGQRPASPLREAVEHAEVIVCAGSGGVGKTTVAAALAIAAAQAGRRAAVITIDPARRLADAMGTALDNEPRPVPGPWPGSLAASMLDTRQTFDDLVTRYAASAEQRRRILANRFYANIANALSGTQEYMANEKLYELLQSGRFDVVVVDTPPSRNALDFLDAPNQLARLLDHRVYRVLTAPGRGVTRIVGRAAQTVVRLGARVVGASVIEDAVAFFSAFEGMESGFRTRARTVRDLLGSERTAFVLVASPRAETVDEAEQFAGRLAQQGIAVKALVVNRVNPRFGIDPARAAELRAAATRSDAATAPLWHNLADLLEVAARDEATITALAALAEPDAVVRVPLLDHDIANLDELGALSTLLTG